jgi:alanyl-tRNA synthetase/misacylated tRNA(Ala) deacylase
VIRHCNIDGIDRNACCGTQCPDLSLIGFLHVLPPSTPHAATEPSSRVPTRLFFVAGPRAVSHLSLASRWLSQAGQVIGVSRAELVPRIEKIEAIRYDTDAAAKSLKAEVAGILGAAAPKSGIAWIHRAEKSTHDYDFMTTAATAWNGAGAEEGAVIVFTSAPPGVTPTLLMVQGKDEARSKSVFEALKTALDSIDAEGGKRVKGGGARGRFMAKVDGKWGKRETAAVQGVIDGFAAV